MGPLCWKRVQLQDRFDIASMEVADDRLNIHLGIDLAEASCRGNRLRQRRPCIGFIEEDLALEVAPFDKVPIDDAQVADPSPHQLLGQYGAQRTTTDENQAGAAEASLTLRSDLWQGCLTLVAIGVHRDSPLAAIAGSPIVTAQTRIDMAIDTQLLMDEAAKLGQLVAQHPSVIRYKQAKKAVDDDAEATRMLAELDRQFEALNRAAQSGIQPTDAQQQQLESLQNRIISHIKIKALNLAQVDFIDLLRRITQTIQRPLAETPGATPTAASAGGSSGGSGGPRISGITQA